MRRDQGQAIVEFALVLPVLVVVALAMVLVAELGVARLALQHGASEGARAGALTNDDDAIRSAVAAGVTPLDPARVVTTIQPRADEPPRSGSPRGTAVTVIASYQLPVPLGFVGLRAFAVKGTAVRRIEWWPP